MGKLSRGCKNYKSLGEPGVTNGPVTNSIGLGIMPVQVLPQTLGQRQLVCGGPSY